MPRSCAGVQARDGVAGTEVPAPAVTTDGSLRLIGRPLTYFLEDVFLSYWIKIAVPVDGGVEAAHGPVGAAGAGSVGPDPVGAHADLAAEDAVGKLAALLLDVRQQRLELGTVGHV